MYENQKNFYKQIKISISLQSKCSTNKSIIWAKCMTTSLLHIWAWESSKLSMSHAKCVKLGSSGIQNNLETNANKELIPYALACLFINLRWNETSIGSERLENKKTNNKESN